MRNYYIFKDSGVSWGLFNGDAIGFCSDVGAEIAHVLAEVRAVFVDIFGAELVNSHQILSVVANNAGPMTFRAHHLIFLSSAGLYHLQHIYQFAHELCHFMVPDEVCETYRWFEETLCEAMSWYTLLKVDERGKTCPIKQLENLYPKISNYVADQQNKRIRITSKTVSEFIVENLSYLKKNCYNRAANATVAYGIFPLFQKYPELWRIVPLLHSLTDDMPLHDALLRLSMSADVVESGGNQLIKRLTE